MDINENVLQNILNIIQSDNIDKSVDLKVLNIFYDNALPLYKLEDEYKNIKITNLKIDDINIDSINEKEEFDYIIIIETLEKLVNPNIFLSNLKKQLKNTGNIICSISNIAHRSVLNDLLKGKFTYSDSGILNKSNLRFFTLKEMTKLFDKEGYSLKQTLAIAIGATKEEEDFVNELCSITNENLRLSFNSYSYLITANKRITKTLFDYVINP